VQIWDQDFTHPETPIIVSLAAGKKGPGEEKAHPVAFRLEEQYLLLKQ
jgi:hypothetical protein